MEPIRYVSGGTPIAPAAVVEALQLDEEGLGSVVWSEEAAAALEHALASAGDDAANAVAESGGQMIPLLHIALKSEDLERVRTLLELGARPEDLDFNEDDDDSEGCALHFAAAQLVSDRPEFNGEAVRLLLCAMLDPETRELRVPLDSLLDGDGKTPLAIAVDHLGKKFTEPPSAVRDVEEDAATAVVRLLLSCGSSAAAVASNTGKNVLHVAAESAPAQCVSLLLESPTATAEALAAADATGAVPLQRALALGRGAPADSVQLLLRRQAALVAPAVPGGAPPRDAASLALHRFLRDYAAEEPVKRDMARKAERVDLAGCVQQLLEAGARPDYAAEDADGVVRTPLAVAARLGVPPEVARTLVEAKAPLDAVDAHGRCALMLAAANGHKDVLSVLLEEDERLGEGAIGAAAGGTAAGEARERRVHASDAEGATALMLSVGFDGADAARAKRQLACTHALLEKGADLQALDALGRCALLRALLPGPMLGLSSSASAGGAAAGGGGGGGGGSAAATLASTLLRAATGERPTLTATLGRSKSSSLGAALQQRANSNANLQLGPPAPAKAKGGEGQGEAEAEAPAASPAAAAAGGAAEDEPLMFAAAHALLGVERWKTRLEVVKLLLKPEAYPEAVAALDRLPAREAAAAEAQMRASEEKARAAAAEGGEEGAAAAAEGGEEVEGTTPGGRAKKKSIVDQAKDAAKGAAKGAQAAARKAGGKADTGAASAQTAEEAKAQKGAKAAKAAAAMAVLCDHNGDCALALAAELAEPPPKAAGGGAPPTNTRELYELLLEALRPCGGLKAAGGFALVSAARFGRLPAATALLSDEHEAVPLFRPRASQLSQLGCLLPPSVLNVSEERWRLRLRLPSTALVAAAAGGHEPMLKLLVEHGALKVWSAATEGHAEDDLTTPLMAAAEAGSEPCVDALLGSADLPKTDTKDAKGRTALLRAAASAVGAGIEKLLRTNFVDAEATDADGAGALVLAARAGNQRAVATLWEARALVTLAEKVAYGKGPMLEAAMYGNLHTVEELQRRGGGTLAREALKEALRSQVGDETPEGRQRSLRAARLLARVSGGGALAWQAVEIGRGAASADMLRQLLAQTDAATLRAESVERDARGRTLLHAAVEEGKDHHAVALAEKLAEEALLLPNTMRLTPIGLAVVHQQDNLVDRLERVVLARLNPTLEVVHGASEERLELAQQLKDKVAAYWPLLTVRMRPASGAGAAGRAGTAHAFDVLWVEKWAAPRDGSRRSAVLYSQPAGATLPTVRHLLTTLRKKIEGDGILDNLSMDMAPLPVIEH